MTGQRQWQNRAGQDRDQDRTVENQDRDKDRTGQDSWKPGQRQGQDRSLIDQI